MVAGAARNPVEPDPARVVPVVLMYCKLLTALPTTVLLIATLSAAAQVAPKGADCVEAREVAPERVIEHCDELLMDGATAETRLPDIFLARADAFVRQGRLRLAVEDLGHVVERRPDDATAFFRRAELQRALGNADAAIGDFSSAIRLESKNIAALFARAELYHARSERRRALADYAAILRLDPLHEAAGANHKALALEIERLGAMMPVRK